MLYGIPFGVVRNSVEWLYRIPLKTFEIHRLFNTRWGVRNPVAKGLSTREDEGTNMYGIPLGKRQMVAERRVRNPVWGRQYPRK
jgi:hypothetical protein